MNTSFLSDIEDTIQWLVAPERADSRYALLDPGAREGEERALQRAAAEAGAEDPASPYLHEAGEEPNVAASVARQHWATPYNNDYVVVTLRSPDAFKMLDVLALSTNEELTFDDLKIAADRDRQQGPLDMIQPLGLQGEPWVTSITVPDAKTGGDLYLHYFFVARARPGEGAIARKATHRKVWDAATELPQIGIPRNEVDAPQVAQPAIPPNWSPQAVDVSAALAHAAPQVSAGASLPYQRLFLTLFPGDSSGLSPWKSYVVINAEPASGQQPGAYDYIALADHSPSNAEDYQTRCWSYVSGLTHGAYETGMRCDKKVDNQNLIVADLDTLEQKFIFYAGWVNKAWTIIGNPVSFKTQKHWMTESLPEIGQKRLPEIVIPGAHDAGTFDLVSKTNTVNAQAQNLSFSGQLSLGIRYFDCRIWNYPSYSQPFYFYHGVASTWTEITGLLSDLRTFFTQDNSRDIVILDFCRFGNFGQPDYDKFFNLFKNDSLFANAMMTPEEAKQLTINELVSQGKRLLLLCEDTTARARLNLGESINLDANWPNTPDLSDLKSTLDGHVKNHTTPGELWSLQAILTPRALNSLAWYAPELFPVLHGWVVNDWWDTANVVMCDFTAGTDLVHAAQVCNTRRHNPQQGNLFWYEHAGWQTGTGSPSSGLEIGTGGWTNFKSVFATSNGWIYAIDWDGNLHRYQDTHWQSGAPMTNPRQTISSSADWPQYRKVFASSDGRIYAITGNYMNAGTGKLWRWQDTGGNQLGAGALIDAGWENYKTAFATNDGVIYGIDSLGKLWRWKDTGSGHLGTGTQIDSGWENYRSVFATSDGVIYGIDWQGNLWWWKDAGSNQLGAGKQLGAGWGDFRMIFATTAGRFYGIKA